MLSPRRMRTWDAPSRAPRRTSSRCCAVEIRRSPMFAMDPEAGDAIRNGADDNASGTAAVLDLARLLKANPPRRSVIFVNFSAEELGVLGSSWFVNHPPVPIERMVAMLNFDMVGRLRNDKLIVYGTSTATELKGIVDSANAVTGSV